MRGWEQGYRYRYLSGVKRQWGELARRAAARYGLDHELVLSVISAESAGNPQARSRAGAMGLMQLMPGTAQSLGVRNPYDPVENIMAGARYLSQLVRRYGGDLAKAVAAYNMGPHALERRGYKLKPGSETYNYVQRVIGIKDPSDLSRPWRPGEVRYANDAKDAKDTGLGWDEFFLKNPIRMGGATPWGGSLSTASDSGQGSLRNRSGSAASLLRLWGEPAPKFNGDGWLIPAPALGGYYHLVHDRFGQTIGLFVPEGGGKPQGPFPMAGLAPIHPLLIGAGYMTPTLQPIIDPYGLLELV